MTKRILVGVDGSEFAVRAAFRAAQLAGETGADLQVISAGTSFDLEHLHGTTDQSAQETVAQIVEDLRRAHNDLAITGEARIGAPADALVEAARESAADMIVIGNRHAQGVRRLLGSVAHEVVSRAPCDVYIVNTTS